MARAPTGVRAIIVPVGSLLRLGSHVAWYCSTQRVGHPKLGTPRSSYVGIWPPGTAGQCDERSADVEASASHHVGTESRCLSSRDLAPEVQGSERQLRSGTQAAREVVPSMSITLGVVGSRQVAV